MRQRLKRIRELSAAQLVRTIALRSRPSAAIMRGYYRAKFWDPIWRDVVNRRSVQLYRADRRTLSPLQLRLATDLQHDGIAVFNVDELLGVGTLRAIRAEADRLLNRPKIRDEIAAGRGLVGGKDFVVRVFKRDPVLDLATSLGSMCVDDRVLAIVNRYMGMFARLKSFDLWHNVPVKDPNAPEISSQQWHRDYDDRRLVKLFVYLVDVDESMGPFTYLPRTQPGGKFADVLPSRPPLGAYPPQSEVDRLLPVEQPRRCSGVAGTAILCDTTGFHKGGRSTSRPRELFVATYASDGAIDPDAYSTIGPVANLSAQARFAVRARA